MSTTASRKRTNATKIEMYFRSTISFMVGFIFSKSGMSADPTKISATTKAGPPLTTEEAKNFLQACQFNAKFAFQSDEAYAQITKPMRDLLKQDAKFQ